jgi:hypothetical protein
MGPVAEQAVRVVLHAKNELSLRFESDQVPAMLSGQVCSIAGEVASR